LKITTLFAGCPAEETQDLRADVPVEFLRADDKPDD